MSAYISSPHEHKPPTAAVAVPGADAKLLSKINNAVAAANDAEQTVTTAQAELVSRSKAVGLLLLEAKKLYPAVEDFKTFLKKVQGLKLSRAYDLMRLAGGRTTDEEIRQSTRERVKKHRGSNKKLPRPVPQPEPPPEAPLPLSVTHPDVTESAEVSAEKRKADYAAELADHPAANGSPAPEVAWSSNAFGGTALTRFKDAADQWLPLMSKSDRAEALAYVRDFFNEKEAA